MKTKLALIVGLTVASIAMTGCNQNYNGQNESSTTTRQSSPIEIYQEFPEYGFAITAPCRLKDVSSQSSGDFLLNYGGTTDANDASKMAAYQLVVNRVPVGYKNLPKEKYEEMMDEQIRSRMSAFRNVQSIRFGYEGYKGYVGDASVQGYSQKGAIFVKDNYIIALTVITNNDLTSKFNKFTNGFKSIPVR